MIGNFGLIAETLRICDDHAPQAEPEFTMNTYVAIINGKAVLVFRAEDDDEARAIIEDEGGSMRSDLRALAGMDGKVAMGREVRQ